MLPNFHRVGLIGKAIDKLMGKLFKVPLNAFLPNYYSRTGHLFKLPSVDTNSKNKKQIICSLTSFPARIEQTWIAIESLFRQSTLPDRIILWLSLDQFPNREIPDSLKNMQSRGLEIEFCEGDVKAHKKYLYALTKFPKDLIITYDDDLYYDRKNIENLLLLHKKYPDFIVTNRAHRIRINDGKDQIQLYRKWKHNSTYSKPSYNLVATGGYGALYQSHLLHYDTSNKELIKKLCLYADDIWLKIMASLNRTLVVTNDRYGKDPILISKTQKEKLVTTNVLSGGNDEQLFDLMTYYDITSKDFKD